jgi:hypothetical protein
MIIKSVYTLVMLIIVSGCTQSKEYSIYNPENEYNVGNKEPMTFPVDIKLRKAQSAEFYIKPKDALPKPIPSILPPDSKALEKKIKNESKIENTPYYDKVAQYPLPKQKDVS